MCSTRCDAAELCGSTETEVAGEVRLRKALRGRPRSTLGYYTLAAAAVLHGRKLLVTDLCIDV
jgi:hypothetical protein